MDKDKRKNKGKNTSEKKGVISLTDYKKKESEKRRREYERILFNRILGVYSFAESDGLHHVEVIDISFKGIRFREDKPQLAFSPGDKIALRFYFTPSTYLRLILEVKRVEPFQDEDREGLEYGCIIDNKTKSHEVIQQLVKFMHRYSELSVQDENPPMIWF